MPAYPNLNFQGSSGWGVSPDGQMRRLTTTPSRRPTGTDHAIWDASSGRVVSYNTGQPFSGVDPGTGKNFERGVEVQAPRPGTSPAEMQSRYQPVEVMRSPATASAQEQLMEQFRKSADSALEDFGSYLSTFKEDLSAARSSQREATDITPTVNALSTAQRDYSGGLDEADQRYQAELAAAAARERGIVEQAQALLPQYDTALNNISASQLAQIAGQVNRYKMGTGTPRSMGSSENRILARASADAMLPLEREKIQRRYDILGSLAMPAESRIAARGIDYAGSFLPGTENARYVSATNLATTIQGLKEKVAGMRFSDAVNYLRAMGIPAEIQNEILSGQTRNLGALNALEEASRYRGLMDTQPVELAQPMSYNMSLPSYPNFTPRYPMTNNTGTTPPPIAPNAPTTVAPGVPYRPLTGAPGGTPFDYNAYFASRSNPRYAPTPAPTALSYVGGVNVTPEEFAGWGTY